MVPATPKQYLPADCSSSFFISGTLFQPTVGAEVGLHKLPASNIGWFSQ